MIRTGSKPVSVEVCAGAGGQAVGLHKAGFRHAALIEIDDNACDTLELNVKDRKDWAGCRVLRRDLTTFDARTLGLRKGSLDLLAGGVPCPPFSSAGKQLGEDDERDLFPTMLDLVGGLRPKAVMIENVRGLLEPSWRFEEYREKGIKRRLRGYGYEICGWKILEAWHYGVPQLRPRAVLVAMLPEYAKYFAWPVPGEGPRVTVGEALRKSMRERFKKDGRPGWESAYKRWHSMAVKDIAPTLVGGSKKHGGADLGPSRAKEAWKQLGVNGLGVANDPESCNPGRDLYSDRGPMLTVSQAALVQGFPEDWQFSGRKTAAYRQVGNAFPPPVAEAVGRQIGAALRAGAPASAEPAGEGLFDLVPSALPGDGTEPADRGGDLESAVAG